MALNLESNSSVDRALYKSDVTAVASVVSGNVDPVLVNVAIGCHFLDSGGDLVLPTSGTVTILVKTENTQQWEAPPNNEIDASAPTTVIVAGNITAVQATPSTVAGGTVQDYQLVVTANRGV